MPLHYGRSRRGRGQSGHRGIPGASAFDRLFGRGMEADVQGRMREHFEGKDTELAAAGGEKREQVRSFMKIPGSRLAKAPREHLMSRARHGDDVYAYRAMQPDEQFNDPQRAFWNVWIDDQRVQLEDVPDYLNSAQYRRRFPNWDVEGGG